MNEGNNSQTNSCRQFSRQIEVVLGEVLGHESWTVLSDWFLGYTKDNSAEVDTNTDTMIILMDDKNGTKL